MAFPEVGYSACPHDCPSTCALEVEVVDKNTIGRVRGAKDNSYTAGVVCEKVARYGERLHHKDRLTGALRRGPGGAFQPIGVEEALDEVAERFIQAEQALGSETVWPFYYAGTMGLVMRDGINRLTNARNYSRMYDTYCVATSFPGFMAGTGRLAGPDPREMAVSDCVVLWGTNPVHTQINVMTHVTTARKTRGAKLVVVDVYETATMKQADLGLVIRPGTDGALACAIMHVLFRDGYADRDYLAKMSDVPGELEAHLQTRGPDWAATITGLPEAEIEQAARLIGQTQRCYFRLGYGFTRQRNGAINMHAASCIATVTGAWQYEGGGAFHNNGAIYGWDKTLIEGRDMLNPSARVLDQSHIGRVLLGEGDALAGGVPVTAMLIQNTNPVSVAPDQTKVKQGFARPDLFVCVHEQFMTETAQMADIVLPATMFLEHDDVYQAGGQQHILFGPKLVEAPGECLSNHDVICGLAKRLGAQHAGFDLSVREIIDQTLQRSGHGTLANLEKQRWIDVQPNFEEAHYINGFAHEDGKFHFRPEWAKVRYDRSMPAMGEVDEAPQLPDFWDVLDMADAAHPFRLATSPARGFLNSTFNETVSSRKREGRPCLLVHPDDMVEHGLSDGDKVHVGNEQGVVVLRAKSHDGVQRGVLIAESVWPNEAFENGNGINTLTKTAKPAPAGGAPYHDTAVWLARA